MAQTRTVADRITDVRQAYNAFRDEITSDQMREMVGQLTNAQAQAAAQLAASQGDVRSYADIVNAGINIQRVVAANDRAALIAAVMATQSGVSRPTLDVIDGE